MRRRLLSPLLASLLLACHGSPPPRPASAPPTREQRMRARCCAECTGAASRDPAGMDISGKTCTTYPAEWNGGPGISDECRAWFVAQPQSTLVGDCWKVQRRDGGLP